MSEARSFESRQVLRWMKSVNRTLSVGAVGVLLVLLARLFGDSSSVRIAGIELPLQSAWVFFAAITAVHVYTGYWFRYWLVELRRSTISIKEKRAVREDLAVEGGHFVGFFHDREPLRESGGMLITGLDSSLLLGHLVIVFGSIGIAPWWRIGSDIHWPGLPAHTVLTTLNVVVIYINWSQWIRWSVEVTQLLPGRRFEGLEINRSSRIRSILASPFNYSLLFALGITLAAPLARLVDRIA